MIATRTDPRCQPFAYVTDGTHLFEVIDTKPKTVILEDCSSLLVVQLDEWRVKADYKLVRPAPAHAPDRLERVA